LEASKPNGEINNKIPCDMFTMWNHGLSSGVWILLWDVYLVLMTQLGKREHGLWRSQLEGEL